MAWEALKFAQSVILGGICAGSGGHLISSKFSQPTNDDWVKLPRANFAKTIDDCVSLPRVNFAKLQTTPPLPL